MNLIVDGHDARWLRVSHMSSGAGGSGPMPHRDVDGNSIRSAILQYPADHAETGCQKPYASGAPRNAPNSAFPQQGC